MQQSTTYQYLIWLALPSIFSALFNNLYRLIDQYFVQWLSAEAQAALGASTFILISGYALFTLVSAGVAPFIARYTGSKEEQKVHRVIKTGCILMLMAGLLFSLILSFGAPYLTESVGLQGKSAQELNTYLFWLGIAGTSIAFGPLLDAIWIARGDTQTPMKLQLLSTALNIILNWIFIFALNLGIMGAALASGISRWVVVCIGFFILHKEFPLSYHQLFPFKKILKMGFPVAMGTILYSGVYWMLMYICISPLGDSVHVALGLGFSVLEGVSYPLYSGVMMAVSSIIGRQLGSGNHIALDATIKKGAVLSFSLGTMAMLVFLFAGQEICSQFTQSEDALEQAVLYAQILAFSQIFVAMEAMSEGVLSGSGDNKRLFWLSAPFNLLRVPLAYGMCFGLGMHAAGIWWAINISTYIKCCIKCHAVYKGKWRTITL